jgi:hypothetical protein
MSKSRLIWGIVCLGAAVLLAVLPFLSPEVTTSFMVEGTNMPWIPPLVLGILGIWLLATARRGEKEEPGGEEIVVDEEKLALNKRLETIGWGCFLIMLGGFMFVPHDAVAQGFWSIGVGLIMLGLNLARYFYNIKMSGFTTVLGIIALIAGIAQLFSADLPSLAILLVILGAYLILKPWFEERQLFGKAEEG